MYNFFFTTLFFFYTNRFVACKILSVILLTIIYLDAAGIPDKFRRQENVYFDHMKDMEQSPAETVMCSFNVSLMFVDATQVKSKYA